MCSAWSILYFNVILNTCKSYKILKKQTLWGETPSVWFHIPYVHRIFWIKMFSSFIATKIFCNQTQIMYHSVQLQCAKCKALKIFSFFSIDTRLSSNAWFVKSPGIVKELLDSISAGRKSNPFFWTNVLFIPHTLLILFWVRIAGCQSSELQNCL